jgi:hypothetical protein
LLDNETASLHCTKYEKNLKEIILFATINIISSNTVEILILIYHYNIGLKNWEIL